MRRSTIAIMITVVVAISQTGAALRDASSADGRSSLLLNGVWECVAAPDGQPPADGWRRVRVPHRSREFEEHPPDSAWYRTTLQIPDNWRTESSDIVLDLSRVRHFGRVYLEGKAIPSEAGGEHYGMRTPFEIRLTGLVEPGKSYTLLIYTHNCSGNYAHPTAHDLGAPALRALDSFFWYDGAVTVGIEGDAWLRLQPRVRVDDLYVVTSVRTMTLSVEATLRNDTPNEIRGTLELAAIREGKIALALPGQRITLAAKASQVVRVSVPWKDPVLWGRPPFGQPDLYFLRAELKADGTSTPLDTRVQRFGFREIWADGDKLVLNGKPLFLWGDHSFPYVHERQFLTRKLPDLSDANVSIIENHRHDVAPVLFDVADELGVFVVSSNFCVGTGAVPGNLSARELPVIIENHLKVADTWIRRERDHPSILFWDVTDTWEPAFCVPLMKKVRELDATRMVEVTYNEPTPEMIGLMDTYRLFSGLPQINAAIEKIRAGKDLPKKPIRVGEAGIFSKPNWPADQPPPMLAGWMKFLKSMPARGINGLQTFYLTDMDYHAFKPDVPGSLAAPMDIKITWPAQSGTDARIDPFGEGTREARGATAMYLNWCDPDQPVSLPTATRAWSKKLFHELNGADVAAVVDQRLPEVIVTVTRGGSPVSEALVFVHPLDGQAVVTFGIRADHDGKSWFVLPEPGAYRFTCRLDGRERSVDVACQRQRLNVAPGYSHIQWAAISFEPQHEKRDGSK